jgi:hypothetical protein
MGNRLSGFGDIHQGGMETRVGAAELMFSIVNSIF